MTKDELRKLIEIKRKELFISGKLDIISKKIVENILNWNFFKEAENIALYYPIKNEINLLELLSCKNKSFYFPKCIENNLQFAKYDNNFEKGCFNIPEPKSDTINAAILDLIFIPSLCCNTKCYRLGYGRGFYDRFFTFNKINAAKIIVSSNCFITDDFKEEEFDYKCDYIISENGIFK